jgi:hypothetical protein
MVNLCPVVEWSSIQIASENRKNLSGSQMVKTKWLLFSFGPFKNWKNLVERASENRTIQKPDPKSVRKMTIQKPDHPVFECSLYLPFIKGHCRENFHVRFGFAGIYSPLYLYFYV